jgi:hypothetical protein
VTLTLLAFNTAQIYRTTAGEHLADQGIRRLGLLHRPALGLAPAIIYLHDMFGVFALEELLTILDAPPKESLLPYPRPTSSRTTIPP